MINLIQKNGYFFIPYALFLLIGGGLLALFPKKDLFLYMNEMHHGWADFFFLYFTHVGDGIFAVIVVFLLLFVRFRFAVTAAACFILTSLTAQFFKQLVFNDAFRPVKYFEGTGHNVYLVEGVTRHSLDSFPSGHATTAFSVFCLLSLIAARKKWGLFFFLLALLAAYSRVYLAQHFFGDVYFGSLIGVVLTVVIFYYLQNRFGASAKAWLNQSLMKK